MKRQIAWILTLVLLFGLTACASQEPEGTSTSPITDPPGSNGSSKPIMKEPPRLTVSFGRGETYDAEMSTYTWTYDTGDGMMSGICADSPHPLDLQEFLTPVETTVNEVELQFEVQPQSFSVRCWPDSLFGNPTAESKQASVSGNMLELKDGGYVYEVEATWTGENLAAEGTVHYAFYVIKHSVQYAHDHTLADEPQTVSDPVSGYCGNTITKILIDGEEYAFWGSDSVNLTDLLINLKYDPALLCKCQPDFYVETEFGMSYGVGLSGYARCEDGQADLTSDQIELIQKIVDNQT